MKQTNLGPLQDGGRVGIIGGGPGGVATAIAIKQGARALGREARVVIMEGKQFAGEQHHNQCAGVLSPPIADLIERDLKIPFPHALSRSAITGYILHGARREIILDGETEPSVALRRVQFDAYMLNAARECGVEVLPARVTAFEFHADRVVIYTENTPREVEVVVGAFGMDEGSGVLFENAVGYRPPLALNSVVTKYHPGEEGMIAFGNRIHAFLPTSPRIEFGGITPKGNHLTINIAGDSVDADLMSAFLAMPQVRFSLPNFENAGRFDANDLRFFKGRFPRGLAHNFFGDRFVMVGDAAGLVRAFKGKGVTSAIQTGIRAAEVILRDGISSRAFQNYYRANADIIDDLPYGRVMRQLTITASRFGLMDIVLRAAERDSHLRHALFDAVSAHRPYRDVVREGLTRDAMWAMIRSAFKPLNADDTDLR